MNPTKKRLVVLISGNGSNLQAIIDACARGQLQAEVVAVVASNAKAYGLERARQHGIPSYVMPKDSDRAAYDRALAAYLKPLQPDYIVLAGWLRLLSMHFLQHFPQQVINLHPALPATFAGLHAIERAYEAFQQGKIKYTGVMVHAVPDEGVDDGPVLAQEVVAMHAGESLAALSERMHAVEHRLLVETLAALCFA